MVVSNVQLAIILIHQTFVKHVHRIANNAIQLSVYLVKTNIM